MNLNDIRVAIDHVIEDAPLLYDLSVTTPPPDLVRQRTQDHYNTSMPDSHGKDFSIHENCKSVIVWNVFSTVAYDYHYKNEFRMNIKRTDLVVFYSSFLKLKCYNMEPRPSINIRPT